MRQQVAVAELHLHTPSLGIGTRQGQGLVRDIPGLHPSLRQAEGQRQGDAARTGAHIEHPSISRHQLQHPLHQFGRFGPGNQHTRSYPKRASQEGSGALNVLNGFVAQQPVENILQTEFVVCG